MEAIKERIQENWNKNANNYDEQYLHGLKSPEEAKAWHALLRELIPVPNQKILDVGTGTGFLALLLAEQGHRCKGIDLSPGMLSEAIAKAKKANLDILFEVGDAEALTDADNSYDIVINRHILWTMPHPQQAVEEWTRVLKPGGYLIVIDGDWFFNSFKNNVQIFIGKLLTLASGGGNLFRRGDSSVKNSLPMTQPKNAKNAPKLLEQAGLSVTIREAENVLAAERAAMPITQRLLNPHKRIILIGQKAV